MLNLKQLIYDMENVFIIGNGFDLDLGLPTNYLDFAESKFWPETTKKESNNEWKTNIDNLGVMSSIPKIIKLEEAINKAKLNKWFDLEEELLNYAKDYYEVTDPYYNCFCQESEQDVTANVKYYRELLKALCGYINYVQKNNRIRNDAIACEVLNAVVDNGWFNNIYSFNYTDLNAIARQIDVNKVIQYEHLHGKVSGESIILGVDETQLRSGYEIFHKSSSRFYRSNNFYNALINANEIVVFGLSFGSIDYSYFDKFFKNISEGTPIPEDKKQYITIFTKDEDSHLETITKLRKMGINIQRLYAQTHFKIICTTDVRDRDAIDAFNLRLKQSNKEAYFRKQNDVGNFFQ